MAYEAADAGLLSPELAAGIRRVKGVRRIGVRLGNRLTIEQGRRLLARALPSTPRGLRDHAMVAMLIGCGLRRGELLALRFNWIQQREDHRVIADLVGKGGHMRTGPVPTWVKTAVDACAGIDRLACHDLRRTCARLCHLAGGELDQIQFLLWHVSIQTTEAYLGCKQRLHRR